MDRVRELAALVRERPPCVVLSGAGISTESGIPDFRSAQGIWAGIDPRAVASMSAFERDPDHVWDFYRRRFSVLLAAEPNAGHQAIAELERRGIVEAVVTQNIDMLHERAGSRNLIEVHGSIRTSSCRGCRTVYPLDAVLELLEATAGAPSCPACGAVLKPGVVLFEEMLPAAAIDAADELARRAGVLLVVGSSLEVYPVAGLPAVTLRAGGAVAILNRGPTSFDAQASIVVDAPAGEALAQLAGLL